MPRYVSKGGKWYPAKEKAAITKTNEKGEKEPAIYEGPDRAALFELWKDGVEYHGEDFKKNPEFLQAIRNQGFTTVDKFLKWIGYDKEKVEKEFKEKAEVVHKHEMAEKVAMIQHPGGGQDFSGQGKDLQGGFGTAPKISE